MKPVVVLAFDALDVNEMRTWMDLKLMPNFERLYAESARGEVQNPLAFEAGSVWPTFVTGQPLGVHGQYDGPYRFDTDAYELRLMRREERGADPFWLHVGGAGRRVAIVDVPYVLLDEVNGLHVIDWFTHVRTNPPGIASFPPEAAAEIVRRFGENPFVGESRCPTNEAPVDTVEAVDAFRERLLRRVAAKTACIAEVWGREQWDLFVAVFHDAHDAGHMCWHLHDPGHERHDAALAAAVGDPLRDVYVALDRALGELMERFGDEVTLIVYTSHGMGRQRTATRFLDEILARIEERYLAERQAEPARPAIRSSWVELLAPVYRSVVPAPIRRRLLGTGIVRRAYDEVHASSLARRLFFELAANHATGGVRFNLIGRERCGRVAPGQAFDELRFRLAKDLAELRNADTGEPLIGEILWTRDHYDGPMVGNLPDLLLEWNKSAPIRRVCSPLIGTIDDWRRRPRSGDHTCKRGAFWARGPGIVPRVFDEIFPVAAFAPTIAGLLGCETGVYPFPPIALRDSQAATVAA